MIRDVSTALHAEASQHLVGGVNSPVRAFKSVHGEPIYIKDAKGATVTDADGNTLVDFVQSWGPLIHGHAHPNVLKAVTKTMARGTSYGAPHIGEIRLARKVKSVFPMMDLVRFVSSGTEAVMSAIRLARGFTGRDTVLKFEGCYHGHVDALMVNAGSGLATFGIASSPGIPESTVATTVVASLDDEAMVDHIFAEQGDDVAAVVIEPMPANNGLLVQRESFLQHLRTRCDEHGALLIFDEVITGFRFAEGGITGHVGVTPDLVALGKVIGGGLPVGAYGGPEHIMQQLAPLGPVYQAGTLSGNPLAMAAGCATLDLLNDDAHAHLEALGALAGRRSSPPCLPVTDTPCGWCAKPVCSGSLPVLKRRLGVQTSFRARPASCMPTSTKACSNAATCWRLPPTKWASFQPPTKRTTSKASWRRWTTC